MTDEAPDRFEFATSADHASGIVLERCDLRGAPGVRVAVVVDGIAHRVAVEPRDALGLACMLGAIAEAQGRKQNARRPLRLLEGRTAAAAASEVAN